MLRVCRTQTRAEYFREKNKNKEGLKQNAERAA